MATVETPAAPSSDPAPAAGGAGPAPAVPQKNKPKHAGLFRNVLSNWLWSFVGIISGFILPRLIGDHLGPGLLGVWDWSWTLLIYIALLQLSLSAAVNRYVARFRATRDWDALNAVFNTSLALLVVSFILGVGASIALAWCVPYLLPKLPPEFVAQARWCTLFLTLTAALQLPGSVFNAIITGYERFDLLNLVRGGADVLVMVVLIALLLAGRGIVPLALTVFFGEVLSNLGKIRLARRLCPTLRWSPAFCKRAVAKEMLSFGGKAALQNLIQSGLYQLNTILLGRFAGPETLAVYARQRGLVVQVVRFIRQYAQVFIPASSVLDAAQDTKALQRLLVQSSRYGLYLSLPPLLVLLTLGGPVLEVWMGPNYRAPLVLAILALGHAVFVPQMSVYSILMGMNKHGQVVWYDLAAGLLSLVLGLTLMGYFGFGMVGAALAVAIPLAISGGIVMPLYNCRLLNLSLGEYLKQIVPGPVLAALPFAVCLLAARFLFPHKPGYALASGLGVGGLLTAGIYWKWVLPQRLRAKLESKLPFRSRRARAAAAEPPASATR